MYFSQFALNLKPLLMQPPVKGKVTMGLDPGYRMGCKVAVVDGTGKVLDTAVVYPTYGERQKNEPSHRGVSLQGTGPCAEGSGYRGRRQGIIDKRSALMKTAIIDIR